MIKRIAAACAAMIALTLGFAAPAQASTFHGCLDAQLCIYTLPNYGGVETGQYAGSIVQAYNHCWLFTNNWNNATSSYVLNYAGGGTPVAHFYDGATCTGTHFDEANPPGAFAHMRSGWDNRVGSISITQE